MRVIAVVDSWPTADRASQSRLLINAMVGIIGVVAFGCRNSEAADVPRWKIRRVPIEGGLWEQPREGGPPHEVTNFTSGQIFDFNWTDDGKQLLLCRGEVTSDVVLLSNLR